MAQSPLPLPDADQIGTFDRDGAIVPLITALPDQAHVAHERHLCVDTTAAGGNAALLAG